MYLKNNKIIDKEIYVPYKDIDIFLKELIENNIYVLGIEGVVKESEKIIPLIDMIYDGSHDDFSSNINIHINRIQNIISLMINNSTVDLNKLYLIFLCKRHN